MNNSTHPHKTMTICEMKKMWREQAVRQSTSYREANTIYGALAGCGLSANAYYAELRRLGLYDRVRSRKK